MTTATAGAAAPDVDQELEMLKDNQRVAKARLLKAAQELREAENACAAAALALEWHRNRKSQGHRPSAGAV